MERRVLFENRLRDIISVSSCVHIYGAGIVGTRLLRVLRKRGYDNKIADFVITDGDVTVKDGKTVRRYDPTDNNAIYFVAVGDAYLEEIMAVLKANQNNTVYNMYMYSFLDEDYFPEDTIQDMPTRLTIDIRELMMMQFAGGDFLRYDIIYDILSDAQVDGGEVIVDSHLRICGNTGAVSHAIKADEKNIDVIIDSSADRGVYSRAWAEKQYGVDTTIGLDAELTRLKNRWRGRFVALIWPPAFSLAEQIISDMEEQVKIVDTINLNLGEASIGQFVYEIYGTDDVIKRQIADKVSLFKAHDSFALKIVTYEMDAPEFYIKRFGHTISKKGYKLKTYIREKYRNKIDNYLFDVIIHTADNYEQSEMILDILSRYL